MRDNMTGRSRGFAFLNFVDPKAVNTVMVREHYLDGKGGMYQHSNEASLSTLTDTLSPLLPIVQIDPKRAIPRPQQQHHNYNNNQSHNYGGGASNFSTQGQGQGQKLFVGGLPTTVTPASFRNFFEQFGTLAECTCMMDRETGNPRGFGFLTYQDDSAMQHVLSIRPLVFDGKEVDVKRAQSKNDPQSLQIRRQQRTDNPEMGMQQGTGANRYGNNNFGTGSGGFGGTNGWAMNPMMMGMMGGGDPNAMAQMYQNMGGGEWELEPAGGVAADDGEHGWAGGQQCRWVGYGSDDEQHGHGDDGRDGQHEPAYDGHCDESDAAECAEGSDE